MGKSLKREYLKWGIFKSEVFKVENLCNGESDLKDSPF